jgi:glutamate synthase (NADPH/NADH) large chain
VLIGFRDVPVDNSSLSKAPEFARPSRCTARCSSPRRRVEARQIRFERRLFVLRKVISNRVLRRDRGGDNGFYIVSMSTRTIVYKGMFLAYQVGAYYKDLSDERFESALALVHQRFSTNTFPSWNWRTPTGWSPQRRDQHAARQRQLDGGAPGHGDPRRCSATTSTALADLL